jgi:hypothetical protein
VSTARVVRLELIFTDSLIGNGVENDPMRRELELWSTDGRLLATLDPSGGTKTVDGLFAEVSRMKALADQ